MKIGYQGTTYSFNHKAAQLFVDKMGFDDANLVPLHNSQNVSAALQSGMIDYGVMAIHNSIAGEVPETRQALVSNALIEVSRTTLKIKLCLFGNKDIELPISHIYSHEMAINCLLYTSPSPRDA